MIRLEPFEPHHISSLYAPRNDVQLYPLLCTGEYQEVLYRAGNAYSAWVPEGLLGCAGIGLRPDGYPEAWLIGSPLIDRYKVGFHRLVRRMLKTLQEVNGWKTVLSTTNVDDARAQAWIEALGFKRVGIVTAPGVPGTYLRYVKEY